MNQVFYDIPGVGRQGFTITGTTPTPEEQSRIEGHIARLSQSAAPPAPQEDPGLLSTFGQGVARGFNKSQAGLGALGEYLAGNSTFMGSSASDWQDYQKEQRAEANEYYAPPSLFEAEGAWGKLRSLVGTAGESAAPTIAGIGAILTGGALGGPMGALAGTAAATAMYTPQMLNENVEAQIAEHGEVVDWDRALLATGASALVESFTDRVTLGVAGVVGKPLTKTMAFAAKKGANKGLSIAAKVGGVTALSAATGATEEAIQTVLTRWQARLPVGDDEATAEMIEAAVTGAILEGVFGLGAGGYGAYQERQLNKRLDAAKEYGQREAESLTTAAMVNPGLWEARRNPKEPPEKPKPFQYIPMLPDYSDPSREQRMMAESGYQYSPDTPPAKQPTAKFTEEEYRAALDALREGGPFARSNIRSTLGVGSEKANAIAAEMLRRNDARPVGPRIQITVPKGMPTREKSNVRSIEPTKPNRMERAYEVAPVDPVNATPYSIKMGDRALKKKFASSEEARAFAEQNLPGKQVTIDKDSAEQWGIWEKTYSYNKDGEMELVGRRVVNTYPTQEAANVGAREFDPRFSPATIERQKALEEEQRQTQLAEDLKKQMGDQTKVMQAVADHVVGKGRVNVSVEPLLTKKALADLGVNTAGIGDNVIVEGVASKRGAEQIIALAHDLTDPNLNDEARRAAIKGVLGHELIHALRSSDLLTKREWQALARLAATAKMPGQKFTWLEKQLGRSSNVPADQVVEEAIAEMLRAHINNPSSLAPAARGSLGKIYDFFKKIASFGRGRKGEDVLKAILGGQVGQRPEGYGGLGPRDRQRAEFYSSIIVPPFYMKSVRWIDGQQQEKAPAKQWKGMWANAPLPKEEKAWVDLDGYLNEFDPADIITKEHITEYIKANSLDEVLVEDMQLSVLSKKEVDEIELKAATTTRDLNDLVEEIKVFSAKITKNINYSQEVADKYLIPALSEQRTMSPNDRYRVARSALNNILKDFGTNGGSLSSADVDKGRDLITMGDRLSSKLTDEEVAIRDALSRSPQYEGHAQEGGKDYGMVVFSIPTMLPVYKKPIHTGKAANPIGFARFTTRIIDGKKTIFIEEIQSDLHQAARQAGGYRDEATARVLSGFSKYTKLVTNTLRSQNRPSPDRVDIHRLADETDAVGRRIYDRMQVPDAPFKTSWEEFLFKRMLRYAADQGAEQVAWHGSVESLALTEKYPDVYGKKRKPTAREEFSRDNSSLRLLPSLIERALLAGDEQANAVFGSYYEMAYTGVPLDTIYGKIAADPEFAAAYDKYGPKDTPGGEAIYVGTPDFGQTNSQDDTNITSIVNRYLEKLPRIAKSIGKKFGVSPRQHKEISQRELSTIPMAAYFEAPHDVEFFINVYRPAKDMRTALKRAVQAYRNDTSGALELSDFIENEGVTVAAIQKLMVDRGEKNPVPFTYQQTADDDTVFADTIQKDTAGNPIVQRWIMDLTPEMRTSLQEEGQSYFSAVNPDENVDGRLYAQARMRTNPPIDDRDEFFSAIIVPPFYMKSVRWIDSQKQEKAPVEQWKGMWANASIPKEERAWVDLDGYLANFAPRGTVSKKDISEYLRASSMDVSLQETFHHDGVISPDVRREYERLKREYKTLQIRFENEAKEKNAKIDALALKDPLFKRLVDNQRRAGGSNTDPYTVAFTIASLMPYANHVQPGTFSDNETRVDADDTPIVQMAAKLQTLDWDIDDYFTNHVQNTDAPYGQYTQYGGKDYGVLIFSIPSLSPVYTNDHTGVIKNPIGFVRFKTRFFNGKKSLFIEEVQSDLHSTIRTLGANNPYNTMNEREYQDFANRMFRGRQRGFETTAYEVLGEYRDRQKIPDAPFKTSWEELIFKRMVRYAADRNFDEISWHGEPGSISLTEGYGDVKVRMAKPEDRNTIHDEIIEMQFPRTLMRLVDKAIRRGDTEAKDIFEEYLRKFQNGKREDVYNEMYNDDKFYNTLIKYRPLSPGGEEYIVRGRNVTPIFKRYLEKIPRIAKDFSKKFGARLTLNHTTSVYEDPDPADNSVTHDPSGVPINSEGNPNVKRWHLEVNDAMKRSVLEEGQSYFSAVNATSPAGVEPMYAATAPMGARVPANPNPALIDSIEERMLYNNISPALRKMYNYLPSSLAAKASVATDNAIINFQDSMMPMAALIDNVRKTGGIVNNFSDTYLRSRLFAGQTEEMLNDARRKFYEPLIKAITDLPVTADHKTELLRLTPTSRKIAENYNDPRLSLAEVYIYAQHAKERNAVMRKRNRKLAADRPQEYDAGSGMTDAEADAVLDWFNRQPFGAKFNSTADPNSIRSRYRKLIDHTNNVRVGYGLTPDFRNMILDDGTPADTYTDYAPLRGYSDENVDFHEQDQTARVGTGFKVRGKEDPSATGRSSIGANLITNAIMQNETTIVRANKNKVGQSFLQLLRDNPDLSVDVAEILPHRPMKYAYVPSTGTVRRVVDMSLMNDPMMLIVKEDGKENYIKFKDQKIAETLTSRPGMSGGLGETIMKQLLRMNRLLAATRTSWNIEFLVSNGIRDLEAAMVNLSEFSDINGLKRNIGVDVRKAIKGIWDAERTDQHQSDWAKEYQQFKRYGGKTAFYGIDSLKDSIAKMEKELTKDFSGNWEKVKGGVRSIGKFIEDMNSAVENGIRVSTFKHTRDAMLAGIQNPTPAQIARASERAAMIAKRLTVDFNQGGTAKPYMNAWYLFFNASLQGSVALIEPFVRSKKVRAMWAGVVGVGLMQDLLNAMLSDEDDDGVLQYDKIPDYVLETNFVMMDPFGITERGYFKFPLPYLMNGLHNFGRAVGATARGRYTPAEGAWNAVSVMAGALNPLGAANTWLNFVAPTVVDPVIDLYNNENFMGRPIAPPENPFGINERNSQRYWNNTSPFYTSMADWISKLTLGSGTYMEGGVEWSPNQIEYMFEWLGGGAWTFVQRTWDFASPVWATGTLYKAISGDEWAANDVPFIRRVYGNVTSRNDMEYYIANRDKVLRVRAELRDAASKGDRERYIALMESHPTEYRLASSMNAIERERRKIASQISDVQESDLPEDRKDAMVKRLKEMQDDIVGRGNALVRQAAE